MRTGDLAPGGVGIPRRGKGSTRLSLGVVCGSSFHLQSAKCGTSSFAIVLPGPRFVLARFVVGRE